jgi:hypothetical protein
MENEKATFKNGVPVNLPAAALDALEWLEWLRQYAEKHLVFSQPDSQKRLEKATRTLRKHLKPHLPHEHVKK